MSNNFLFFYGGAFSQWYPSEFSVDGVTYNCCEQYMMAQKAKLFNDMESYHKIMNSKSPAEQKKLGREVKNFNKTIWEKHAKGIVKEANLAKFREPILKEELLSTGNSELVEASPYDTIWGIGLSDHDPKRFDKKNWRGTNWLGEVLMKVREELKAEEDLSKEDEQRLEKLISGL